MTPLSPLATGHLGSAPIWAASFSSEVAMSAEILGSMVASSGTSDR